MRGETGKETSVEVRRDDGVATRIGPEPCVAGRKASGEASAGDGAGQPWSRERQKLPGADAQGLAEGEMDGLSQRERLDGPAWSKTLACARGCLLGNREVSRLAGGLRPPVRIGKARSRRR